MSIWSFFSNLATLNTMLRFSFSVAILTSESFLITITYLNQKNIMKCSYKVYVIPHLAVRVSTGQINDSSNKGDDTSMAKDCMLVL